MMSPVWWVSKYPTGVRINLSKTSLRSFLPTARPTFIIKTERMKEQTAEET